MAVIRSVSQRRSIKKKAKPYQKVKKVHKRYGEIAKTGLGRVTALTNNDFGFPDRLSTKLVYGDTIAFNLNTGSTNYITFRMNSLFDPDYTGIGHQPQWFDQLSAVYRNYRVKGSKITVDFIPVNLDIPTTPTIYGPWLVGVTTSAASTLSATSVAALTEDANGNNKILCARNSGKPVVTVTNTYSPMRDLAISPDDPDLGPSTSGNPAQQFFAHIWASDMTSVTSSTIRVRVKVEFQCEFFNRIEGVLS